ncbi:hypothetical protein [Saccharopolyspora gregorii]|uniref:hypothetical protein n=1 Tax=Saccharopolyspora gregorii TaxID=33914 RepID=UPI0031E5102E
MELVVLSFAGGAVVAALVFWPLLRRVRKHADGPPTGRHALRTHRSTAPPTGAPSTGPAPTAKPAAAEADAEPHPIPRQETAADRADEPVPDQPAHGSELGVTVSTLPTALFAEQYEAKFRRTRDRIDRLRTQLHDHN